MSWRPHSTFWWASNSDPIKFGGFFFWKNFALMLCQFKMFIKIHKYLHLNFNINLIKKCGISKFKYFSCIFLDSLNSYSIAYHTKLMQKILENIKQLQTLFFLAVTIDPFLIFSVHKIVSTYRESKYKMYSTGTSKLFSWYICINIDSINI